jgi:hypothetical protein
MLDRVVKKTHLPFDLFDPFFQIPAVSGGFRGGDKTRFFRTRGIPLCSYDRSYGFPGETDRDFPVIIFQYRTYLHGTCIFKPDFIRPGRAERAPREKQENPEDPAQSNGAGCFLRFHRHGDPPTITVSSDP